MQRTNISWTDYTSNPIRALDTRTGKKGWWCSHASTGCEHCYSETLNKRYGNKVAYRAQEGKYVEFVLKEKELAEWRKLPAGQKLFVCDMTDLFHEQVPLYFVERVFDEIERCPDVTFQVLTKRSGRMKEFVNARCRYREGDIPQNIWLGVSAENQETANNRIDDLCGTICACRFVSCEPLLGEIDFGKIPTAMPALSYLKWVIVGGESGAGYRTMNLDWARSIRDQCVAENVPFFFKQQSAYRNETNPTLDGVEWHQFPDEEKESC